MLERSAAPYFVVSANDITSIVFDPQGRIVGRATAGSYGHVLGKSLAIGYVEPAFAAVGTDLVIEVLGERTNRRSVARFQRERLRP